MKTCSFLLRKDERAGIINKAAPKKLLRKVSLDSSNLFDWVAAVCVILVGAVIDRPKEFAGCCGCCVILWIFCGCGSAFK